jgi:hypothetical protein
MKEFKVPKHLNAAFRCFLDSAQFNFPETNDPELLSEEKAVLKLVRSYLGNTISTKG